MCLKIYNGTSNSIIRSIDFNSKGLSLIVDDTGSLESGSNIGKSTAVKVIDLCLGAKSTSTIYKESDTGTNSVIEQFINTNKVYAELLCEVKGETHCFKRELFKRGGQSIDGESISKIADYKDRINEIAFNNYGIETISLRQLIPKFIRLDTSGDRLLKFLGNHTKNYQYNAIYHYLFGIENNGANNIAVKNDNDKIEKDIKVILNKNQVKSIEDLSLKKELVKEEVARVEGILKDAQSDGDYNKVMDEVNSIASEISKVENEKSKLKLSQSLFIEKIKKEKDNTSNIDTEFLRELYEETKINVGESIREFEELIKFHNEMINFRVKSLEKAVNDLTNNINELETTGNALKKEYEEKYIDFKMFLDNRFEDVYSNYLKEKDRLASLASDYEYVSAQEEVIKENCKRYKSNVDSNHENVIGTFNNYLKELSKDIVGERYAISFDSNEENFPVAIVGLNGNPGTGTKKTLITCLDMAHINLILNLEFTMPEFIVHDKMENIDLSELKSIISAARNFNGQYIFPILKDRINQIGIREEEVVLRLSQNDKLFKV